MQVLDDKIIKKLKNEVVNIKNKEELLWTKNSSPILLMKNLSKNLDSIIVQIWSLSKITDLACLIAVGGFGRGELSPHSDIDLQIIVQEKNINDEIHNSISSFVSTLWDVGLEAGHSVRTVDETIDLAKIDTSVATATLELRFLTGKKSLFNKLKDDRKLKIDSINFARHKLFELRQRHTRHQNTPYSLEPNVKESPGGLRDLHTVQWICMEFEFGKSWRQLAFNNLITIEEARHLYRQQSIIQSIRGHLHISAKRREDRLVFDLQTEVAKRLGITDSNGRRASEILMQKYFRAAKLVLQISEMILANLEPKLFPQAKDYKAEITTKITDTINIKNQDGALIKKISIVFLECRGFLSLQNIQDIKKYPETILKIFHVFQTNSNIRALSPETTRLIWNNRNIVNTEFRKNPTNKEVFIQIFKESKNITKTLKLMNNLGIMSRMLPVFRKIVGQMQHDLFHVYTVDQHTLQVIKNIERYTKEEHAHEFPKCSSLMSKFQDKWRLYLAALFHDIAKGRGGDHSELGAKDVKTFCKNFKLNDVDSNLIEFLVREHLTMSQFIQKFDVDEESTINMFSQKVKNKEQLVALYLLTVADIRGTSPKVWNNWKGRLLERLFDNTLIKLDSNSNSSKESSKSIKIKEYSKNFLNNNEAIDFFSKMNVSYFLKHDASDIEWHSSALSKKTNSKNPIVKAKLDEEIDSIKLIVYEKISQGLFTKIVRYFDSNSFAVLDAKINTLKNGYALNTFLLNKNIKSELTVDTIFSLEEGLTSHLKKQIKNDLIKSGRKSRQSKYFPITPTVELSVDEKKEFHILSLTAGDRPGLLYNIAMVLQEHNISVETARISTLGERVEDVFVVKGENLDDSKKSIQLETDLMLTLEA
ncbi:MAG: [protein-PII] uridylyltransferase [Betaproteobacteria bacterium TMED156]|nr:MAG: [protein-PII] uridylyltransferase [Betaproteobacteria bacterium TMED156]|tara:strand:+ start:91 stop:2715 length:2625 start_codon:yes stop_codon:yes gene_type:complete